MKPSSIRYLDPITLAVIKEVTVEEFRAAYGKPKFIRDPEERTFLGVRTLTSPPSQFHAMQVIDVIRWVNSLRPTTTRDVTYAGIVNQLREKDIAVKFNMTIGAVKKIIYRARLQLREHFK